MENERIIVGLKPSCHHLLQNLNTQELKQFPLHYISPPKNKRKVYSLEICYDNVLILARGGRTKQPLVLALAHKISSMLFLSVVRVFLVYTLPFKSIFQRAFSIYFYGFASWGAYGRKKLLFIKYRNLLISASSLTGHRALVFSSIMTDSNYTVKQCILRVLGTLPGGFTAKVHY